LLRPQSVILGTARVSILSTVMAGPQSRPSMTTAAAFAVPGTATRPPGVHGSPGLTPGDDRPM